MGLSLDPERVTAGLPALDAVVADPRMRPIGLVGGFFLVLLGALLQVGGTGIFWNSVVAGLFVFLGVPLFAMGLAAPEPENDRFKLGIEMTSTQRNVVAIGSAILVSSPIVVALLGVVSDFADWVWLAGAGLALVGAALILTGFLAWTSGAMADPSSSQ